MPGRLIYATYADGAYARNFAWNARFFRWFGGADETVLYGRQDLESDPIYAPNRQVFDAKRGAGYWAWKPWAILRALDRCGPDDVVLYQDCGFGLRYKTVAAPRELVRLARRHGFVAGVVNPTYGPNRVWMRRHCARTVGGERPGLEDSPTIEAVISVWTNTARARAFAEEWLRWCLDHDVVRDATPEERADEDAAFFEHRYDQAVLTALCWRTRAFAIEPHPAILPFAKSVAMIEWGERARTSRGWALAQRALAAMGRLRRRAKGLTR